MEKMDVPVAPEALEETSETPTDVSCAYTVGIKKTGEFIFEVHGEEPGLIQLLGLHKYAEHRLEVAKDINQAWGFPLLSQQLKQLNDMLQVALNMLTEQKRNSLVK